MHAQAFDRRTLVILHRALCLGCGVFAVTLVVLHFTGTLPLLPSAIKGLPWLGVFATAVLIPTAYAVMRSLLVRVGEDYEVTALPRRVHAACIIHWAVIEAAVFINLVFVLISGSWVSFATAMLTLAVLVARAPKEEAYARWLTGRP